MDKIEGIPNLESPVSIKVITLDDVKGYHKVLDAVAREHKFLGFTEAPPLDVTKEFVKKNLQENWPHLVAVKGNQIIGWCDVSSLDRPIYDHVGVLGIGLLPEYRGKGIGMKLMIKALELSKKRGLKRVELMVRKSNTSAIKMYKNIGFEIEGTHKKAVYIDGQYDDQLSMAILFE